MTGSVPGYGRVSRQTGSREDGMALLLVLLFVTLLAAIVVDYSYEMRVEAALAGGSMNQMEARLAARSAVAMGMTLIMQDMQNLDEQGGTEFDALTDLWAEGVPLQEFNNAVLQCGIVDEYGKLNLNALSTEAETDPDDFLILALQSLFEARGAEEDLVDAIRDWIDYDDDTRTMGAESEYYSSLSIPVGCKNGPMDSVEELLMVRGMTPEMFFGDEEQDQLPLTELLTVHGQARGRVNVNTAPEEVLLALEEALGRSGMASLILEAREENPFQNDEDLQQRGVMDQESQEGASSRPFVTAGRVFRIQGDGMAHDAKVRVQAYVDRGGQSSNGSLRLLDWRLFP